MSNEAYKIDGVTVTPQGGGFYELTHPGLPEPVKERGKENAEKRAADIAKALSADDGSMDAQGSLQAPPVQEKQNADPKDDELATLRAQLAQSEAQKDALEKENAKLEKQITTKTVVTAGGDDQDAPARVPPTVPRKYDGVLDDKAKAELKRLGIETTDIILEENEEIPPTGLFLGHNGRGYMITPGERVTVPNFLLNVLKDAVTSTPMKDTKSQKIVGYRNRMRYPYRKADD